jgi:glycosyltransferase involved in cell wall biosynthesis
LWQWKAFFVARKLHRLVRFGAFQHLTYENDWMASPTGALLPIPYLRGPGGGAHFVPAEFRARFGAKPRLWEYFRIGMQWVFRHDPFFLIGQERAKVLLMANREALDALPARWRRKAQLLSVNGISSNEFTPPERPTQNAGFAILSAGRLVPLKGFDLALRAFALFSRKHPEAKFVIVGTGPELNRLEKLAQELGIERQAHIEGWMPRERLLANMRFCDVFLFASLRDGGGLVVVEAMAAGKPVVCFDLGGPGLHINPECGFKVPARTPEQGVQDMAEALDRLASDPELRARMGRAAFERARQVYDWDRVAERIIEAYQETIPCERQGPGETPTSEHEWPMEAPSENLPLALQSSRLPLMRQWLCEPALQSDGLKSAGARVGQPQTLRTRR